MRTLMKVKIPTAAGNEAIKNGSLPEIIGKALAGLNAEAAYFTSEDGMRTALIFFDMADSSDIPPAAEPFFMAFDAQIYVRAGDERRRHARRRRQGDGGRLGHGVRPTMLQPCRGRGDHGGSRGDRYDRSKLTRERRSNDTQQ